MMGRKARKTRWRTLNIDEQSDSEESNIAGGVNLDKGYHQNGQKSYYSRFTFSSQSTPTRRYNHDIKSTRSSSTASETKVTFNEDEYTRITTPRQDVLFKKGYLNKPKTYQTQTSTGTSTNSTGNSTGNGTPDHQSADGTEGTDVEYESQFVFPNGFVDQNGIYYINSYEPYPLVVYNAPVCYPEFPRPKRYSTGSLTESASPNNEENSQSGGEANGVHDFNHHQVYNVVYHQGYYYGNTNGTNNNEVNCETEPARRVKKKRRRKLSKKNDDGTASEYTDDEVEEVKENGVDERLKQEEATPVETIPPSSVHEQNGCDETKKCDDDDDENVHCDKECEESTTVVPNQKFDLKPDAEEFIPKAYREPIVDPNIQYVNFQPNFVPIPIPQYPLPPFLPPAIPVNFVPPNAKIVHNVYPNFIAPVAPPEAVTPKEDDRKEEEAEERLTVENKQHFVTPNEPAPPAKVQQKLPNKTDIDIEKIVSKLEEAAKEQRLNETKRQKFAGNNNKSRYYQPKKREERFTKPRRPAPIENGEVKKATPNYSLVVKTTTPKTPEKQSPVEAKAKKSATQWISVASRKKRKNKNGTETEEVPLEDEVVEENDGFESYDPTQLVDVVVEATAEEVVKEEANIPKETEEAIPPAVVVVEEEEEPPKEVVVAVVEEQPPVVEKVVEEEEVKVAKKSKKNTKPQTKRIIIKDTYEVTPEEPTKVQKETTPEPQEPVVTATQESPVSTPEKRTKRKKKKPQKPSIASKSVSVSSSNTTLNNCDDSYDFLLEPSVLDEAEDKTNVEISQELDRLIQKGMYNNLEEKIKSLNSSCASDNFFSSINLTSPLTFEKNNFLKSNEFSTIFKTTTNLLAKPKRYDNDDFNKLNIDFTKIQLPQNEPQPSTSKAGIFLENPEVNEILKDTGNEVPKLEEVVKQIDDQEVVEQEQKKTPEPDATKLYPITQAVKEWMTKTRENTPEVELLKSPTTIKKELCENETKDEEVVLFSTEEWSMSRESSLETEDLLDCWDEEKPVNGHVEEDTPKITEETVDVYESKYGKNEDYLKIQTEVEEKTRKINGTFPKHGNLPYRAICCSIM